MQILITGITGFLGSHLGAFLLKSGHIVDGTSRRPPKDTHFRKIHDWHHRSIFEMDAAVLECDAIIHSAWDLNSNDRNNISACEMWSTLAAKYDRKILFISTYSAYHDFPTQYGRHKAEAETCFTQRNQTIVRPAFIAGNGGMFGNLIKKIVQSKILPLPDGGHHPLEMVGITDVCEAIQVLLNEKTSGEFNLSAGRISLKETVEAIAQGTHTKIPCILPIPLRPILWTAQSLKCLRMRIGIIDNILGYRENSIRSRASDLQGLIGCAPLSPHTAAHNASVQYINIGDMSAEN